MLEKFSSIKEQSPDVIAKDSSKIKEKRENIPLVKKREYRDWSDENQIRTRLKEFFNQWSRENFTDNGKKKSFGPSTIQKFDEGLYRHIKTKRGGEFTKYLDDASKGYWKPQERWSEENIKTKIQDLFIQWKNESQEKRGKFDVSYILEHQPTFTRHIHRFQEGNFEKYLSEEAQEFWNPLKRWTEERIYKEIYELFTHWKEEGGDRKFNPTYIKSKSIGLFMHVIRSKMRFEDYLTDEMRKVWTRQESEEWPEEKIRSTLEDLFHHWQEADKNQRINFGSGYVYKKNRSLYRYLVKDKTFEKYLASDALEQWRIAENIYAAEGLIFQYAVETILKTAGNKNLLIEKSLNGFRPDLIFMKGNTPVIFDIKLVSSKQSVNRDIKNYSDIIHKYYPAGGYLVFLSLTGVYPRHQERMVDGTRIKVKYYLTDKFIDRISHNNKRLLKFVTGSDNALSDLQNSKIQEIGNLLKKLSTLVDSNMFSSKGLSQEGARNKFIEARTIMRHLAKRGNLEELLHTDFKPILDF